MSGATDPRLGSQLGAYRIEALIGRGGMGVVYRATDTSLDRRVALKVIAPLVADDESFRARFLRESKMAAAIDHPNIIPIYEAGEAEGTYFLAMRFVDGTDLEHRLRDGPLQPRAALGILGQLASALDAAHAAGLVHRDVKPANLLISQGVGADRDDHVYLTDFGLTKQSGSETGLTRGGGFVGTLEYIAPEQIEGRPSDGRADQYALAAIAVAALTGTAPFPRDSDVALINAHLHDPPPSLHLRRPELPAEVDAVIARAMAKDPAARYPDCRSFVDALREALGVTATHTRPLPPLGRRDRRLPLVIGSLIGLGVLAVAAFALASGGAPGPTESPSEASSAAAGSGSTDTSADPSPTEDVYPNEAEQALLALLPDTLADVCERGSYAIVKSDAFLSQAGKIPAASLSCRPPAGSGANIVVVRVFDYALGGGNTAGDFNTEQAISAIAQTVQAPGGDCAASRRANGRWSLSGQDAGAIVCYVDGATGDAILAWSYPQDRILVRAVNQRGDSEALYDWFTQNARFIAP